MERVYPPKEEIETLKQKIEEVETILFGHEGNSDLTKYIQKLIKLEEGLFEKQKKYTISKAYSINNKIMEPEISEEIG